MACCGSTFPRAPTSVDTASTTSPPSPLPSTADPARHSAGEHQPKPSTITYYRFNKAVLRRPLEPGLRSGVAVVDQTGADRSAGAVASPQAHVEGGQHQRGAFV